MALTNYYKEKHQIEEIQYSKKLEKNKLILDLKALNLFHEALKRLFLKTAISFFV